MTPTNTIPVFEFVFNPNLVDEGLTAVSIVDEPAILQEFLMFNDQNSKEIQKFSILNEEEQILVGPALISGMLIYRVSPLKGEYYGFFSRETIKELVTNYFKTGKINSFTYQHENQIVNGLTVIESWFVGAQNDKSIQLGYNLPEGSWMISVKVEDTELWNKIKHDGLKGFSVEVLADAIPYQQMMSKEGHFESYTDYPQSVSDAAARGIRLNNEVNNKCATQVGKVRAQQLANREPISYDTVKRMYSYLSRAAAYYNPNDTTACGTISYLLWGGESALSWSERKIKQVEGQNISNIFVCDIDEKDIIKTKLKKVILEAEIDRITNSNKNFNSIDTENSLKIKLEKWNTECKCSNCEELKNLGWCLPNVLPDTYTKEYNIISE